MGLLLSVKPFVTAPAVKFASQLKRVVAIRVVQISHYALLVVGFLATGFAMQHRRQGGKQSFIEAGFWFVVFGF